MARPPAKELTDRELEVMHVFWKHGEQTASEARDRLARSGVDQAYVTVANLVRTLVEKKCLKPVNRRRPYRYVPIRSFEDVSQSLVGELVDRVFQGSRERLLVHMIAQERLSDQERAALEAILKEKTE